MSRPLDRLLRSTILIGSLLLLLPGGAEAVCSVGAANDDVETAVRDFGWTPDFGDPLLIRSGNSFTMDCDAHLQSIGATIMIPGYPKQQIESLAAGDLVRCEVFDANKNRIMTAIKTIPDGSFTPKLVFDFSQHQFRLAAGLYYYMLTPVDLRWGYMRLGSEYADGGYQQDFFGTWGEQSGDASFDISWNPTSGFVATSRSTWSALKARFR